MKVPEPRKLPSGTWFIQMRLNGVSVPVSASTKKECIRQAQLIKAEHQAGARTITYKSEKTVSEVMSAYIDSIRKTASPSTVRGYVTICNNRFLSVANTPAKKVPNWQAVIDREAEIVSAKTLKNAWGFLCTSLRHEGITPPNVHLPQIIPAEKLWLEPDEILRFVPLLKGESFEIPALLALHGLRRSEILALTYEKIDLSSKTITVHGSAVLGEGNVLVHKQTNKNSSSHRIVPIMIPELIAAIERKRDRRPTDLIYTGNVNTLYTQINRLCKANGLPEVGVHGLRHSFASLAFHLGLTEQETMELGGWSDYTTMRKIYTHLAAVDRLRSKNKISEFFSQNANEIANSI